MKKHSESYIMCKNMIDSVFRESNNKFMDYRIERLKKSLPELKPINNTISISISTNTTNENTNENISTQTIKTFYKSNKSLANGSGYSAAKFLR